MTPARVQLEADLTGEPRYSVRVLSFEYETQRVGKVVYELDPDEPAWVEKKHTFSQLEDAVKFLESIVRR